MIADFVILAFAVWRLSSLLANESGPWDIFLLLRVKLGAEVDAMGWRGTSMLSKLAICVWCSSVWIGAIAALVYYLAPRETVFVALGLALSAAAVLVEETLDNIMRE